MGRNRRGNIVKARIMPQLRHLAKLGVKVIMLDLMVLMMAAGSVQRGATEQCVLVASPLCLRTAAQRVCDVLCAVESLRARSGCSSTSPVRWRWGSR